MIRTGTPIPSAAPETKTKINPETPTLSTSAHSRYPQVKASARLPLDQGRSRHVHGALLTLELLVAPGCHLCSSYSPWGVKWPRHIHLDRIFMSSVEAQVVGIGHAGK